LGLLLPHRVYPPPFLYNNRGSEEGFGSMYLCEFHGRQSGVDVPMVFNQCSRTTTIRKV